MRSPKVRRLCHPTQFGAHLYVNTRWYNSNLVITAEKISDQELRVKVGELIALRRFRSRLDNDTRAAHWPPGDANGLESSSIIRESRGAGAVGSEEIQMTDEVVPPPADTTVIEGGPDTTQQQPAWF